MWIWLSWSIRRKNNKSDIYVFIEISQLIIWGYEDSIM